ncbi:MAG: hypothetical protein V1816_26675 [Pseudomonadota bacterium]
MAAGEFNVVFKGLVKDRDPGEIRKKLAAIYKGDASRVDVFFQGKPVLVKKGVDQETALNFQRLFSSAGTVCQVIQPAREPVSGASGKTPAITPSKAPTKTPAKTPAKNTAPPTKPSVPMICPNCGFEQEKAAACVRCGVIVEKILRKTAPGKEQAAAVAPVGETHADETPDAPPPLGRAALLHEEDERPPLNFWEHFPRSFLYPFTGNGLYILLGGAIFFTIIHYLLYIIFIGWMIGLATSCYLLAYFFKVMTSSAEGEDKPPDWPDFSNLFQDIISPVVKMLLTVFVSFLPAILVLIIRPAPDLETNLLLAGGLAVLGAVYYPMALLAFVMSGRLAGLTPIVVIPAILKMPLIYLVGIMTYGFLIPVAALAQGYLAIPIPILGAVLYSALGMYFNMVQMRVLGLMYAANAERLNWFGEY